MSCLSCAESDRWLGKPPLHATVRVLQMAFFRKIITRHDTGLGEAYMDDDFDVRIYLHSPSLIGAQLCSILPLSLQCKVKSRSPKSRQAPLELINSCFRVQCMAVQCVLSRWMTLGL